MQQRVKLTALPNGLSSDGRRLRLSVFVTPELCATPPQDEPGRVKLDGTVFKNWPASVQDIRFDVLFSASQGTAGVSFPEIPSSRVLSSGLWEALLGNTEAELEPCTQTSLPGESPEQTLSYNAKRVNKAIRDLYVDSASRSLTAFRNMRASQNIAASTAGPVAFNRTIQPLVVDLPDIDHLIFSPTSFNENVPVPVAPCPPTEQQCPGEDPPPPGSVKEALGAAVEFHERKPPQRPLPTRSAAGQAPASSSSILEFHERVSQLGEYPILLKHLGLIFDVEVELDPGIPANGFVWVRATTSANVIQYQPPKTIYELKRDTLRFVALSRTQNPQLRDGLLRLDDTTKYGVIQSDLDGAILKAVDFTRNLRRINVSPAEDKPKALAPPSLRTSGISVVKTGRKEEVLAELTQPVALCNLADTGQDIILTAECLVRGYRIDAWPSTKNPGRWRSLCLRDIMFDIPTLPSNPVKTVSDEGWISLGISEENTTAGFKRYVHESLFLWNGWSLVAPRPGKAVDRNGKPDDGRISYQGPANLNATITARPGSLTPLRFGRGYRLRARAVDLAGNDMASASTADFSSATPEFVFRRLEPVPSPILVPREELKSYPGETVDHLVIRSNYNTSPTRISERHVAPPKTSEYMAEMHGMLDGSQTPDKSSYALIVARDENLSQDAVHPEKQLKLPYLPDPLSRGAAFHGLPGTTDTFTRLFDGGWPNEQPFRLTITEGDGPPLWKPNERVLEVQLRKAQIAVVQLSSHFNLNDPDRCDLELMEMWKWLQEISPPPVPGEALKGLLWMLTPFRELILIHAVQQPLQEPVFNNPNDPAALPFRAEKLRIGDAFAQVSGRIYFDRESSGKLELKAQWAEPLDDPLLDAPQMLESRGQVFERNISYPGMGQAEPGDPVPVQGGWALPFESRHEFGDTKYRRVTYFSVATTRFREQFGFTDEEISNGKSITRETPPTDRQVREILSSARPDAPRVLYIIPLFGWKQPVKVSDKKSKTEGVSRQRMGGGLRVYLDRPWYSSGEGELLGAVLWPGASAHLRGGLLSQVGAAIGLASLPPELPHELKPYVSQWGMDPLWRSNTLDVPLLRQHFLNAKGGGAIDLEQKYTLEEFSQAGPYSPERLVSVVAFEPKFDASRKLWYCDIEMDTQGAYYPFVRLALVRFQPRSVVERGSDGALLWDCHLSRVVLAEFAQLAPDRTASVVFESKKKKVAHVCVRGVTYQKSDFGDGSSEMEVRLETRNRRLSSGWAPVPESVVHLTPQPAGDAAKWKCPPVPSSVLGKEVIWSGDVTLKEDYDDEDYRLVFREYERFHADSQLYERRLIYADVLEI